MQRTSDRQQGRKNRRLALLLGGLALFFFITSFPLWRGVLNQVVGS